MERIKLVDAAQVPPGEARGFQLDENRLVVVCNVAGTHHAMGGNCPHRGASMAQGTLEGHVLTCPWHGWRFDAATGKGVTNPHSSVPVYRVVVEDGGLVLEVD
jgi:nitrite reductase (NADH) small subunit